MQDAFVDIHCHLLPQIDDGSSSWECTLAMARMAVEDGTKTIIVTPHQLGNYSKNRGEDICFRTHELQQFLDQHQIPLQVLPGADVRIEDNMIDLLESGDVLSLADRRKHVLLELPHELYFPIEGILEALRRMGMQGILSHPERNHGILREPQLIPALVEQGCLMQVTAGSLMGTFGPSSQKLSEWMLSEGMVHFIATDAHGIKSRRPLMFRAFERVAEITYQEMALDLCSRNPGLVAQGKNVPSGRLQKARKKSGWKSLFSKSKAA